MCVYIYIYIERERERDNTCVYIYIYIYTHTQQLHLTKPCRARPGELGRAPGAKCPGDPRHGGLVGAYVYVCMC